MKVCFSIAKLIIHTFPSLQYEAHIFRVFCMYKHLYLTQSQSHYAILEEEIQQVYLFWQQKPSAEV